MEQYADIIGKLSCGRYISASKFPVVCNFGKGGKKVSKIHEARARNAEDTRRVGTPSFACCLSSFTRVRVFCPASYLLPKLVTTRSLYVIYRLLIFVKSMMMTTMRVQLTMTI